MDNNGAGDLIFQNNTNGNLQIRLQAPASTVTVGGVGGTWRAVGTGQFSPDTDRTAGVLLQQTTTGNLEVITDITGAQTKTPFTIQPGSADWKAITAGDFNGDAASDVLLQNTVTGAAEIMFLNTNYGDAPRHGGERGVRHNPRRDLEGRQLGRLQRGRARATSCGRIPPMAMSRSI